MRRRRLLILAIVALPACGLIAGLDKDFEEVACLRDCTDAIADSTTDTSIDTSTSTDAAKDARDADADADADASPPCNLSAAFADPKLLLGLENRNVSSARFADKENLVIFTSENGCAGDVCLDLFTATRTGPGASYSVVGPLKPISNNGTPEYWPTLSADNKLLYFESARTRDGGAVANSRIWAATRVNEIDQFGQPILHDIFDVTGTEQSPYLHPDGTHLYFASLARVDAGENSDLFVTELTALGPKEPKNLGAPNSSLADFAPLVTRAHTKLYFARGDLKRDIFISTRPTATGEFGDASAMSELNTADDEYPSWISDDECRFYFISDRPTGTDSGAPGPRLWVASRPK